MKKLSALAAAVLATATVVFAHDPNGVPISWNREISRIVFERCASCHRRGGTSFSLMTYQEAQPRAAVIKDAVLSRRMPPWGAVKGFGSFQDEEGLTQQEIELIADWVEGGTTKGNNPNTLPTVPKFKPPAPFTLPNVALSIFEGFTLRRPMIVAGVYPEHVSRGASMQVVAALPNGDVEPLIWLYEFNNGARHPFMFRKPLELPAQTVIHGVASGATIFLIPGRSTVAEKRR